MNKKVLAIVAAFMVVAVGVFIFMNSGSNEQPPVTASHFEYSPGEYFVTNIKDSNRLLKVALVLITNTDAVEEALTRDNSLIRHEIILILRTLSEEDIKSNDTIASLQEQITGRLNERIGISNIVEVRFNDFVMQ